MKGGDSWMRESLELAKRLDAKREARGEAQKHSTGLSFAVLAICFVVAAGVVLGIVGGCWFLLEKI